MRFPALLVAVATLAAFPAAASGAARPDPGFGAGKGYVTTAIRGNSAVSYAAAVTGGRIVVVGQAITSKGNGQVLVARYLSSGRLDSSFGTRGIFRSTLPVSRGPFIGTSLAVVPRTGALLVGGGYGQGSMLALRLTSRGRLDRTFAGGRGYATVNAGGQAQTVVLDSAGRVLLGGSNANANGRPMVVARLTRTGKLDRTFGDRGQAQSIFWNPLMASSAGVSGLAVTPGGSVVAMGHLDYIGGDGHGSAGVFSLTSAGKPQAGFGDGGHAEIAFPAGPSGFQQWFPCALLRDGQGRITIPGNGSDGSAGAVLSIRLTSAGALDPSFGTGGRSSVPGPSGASDTTCGAAPASGGGLTVGVGSTLARITGAGAADTTFGPGGRIRVTSPGSVGLNATTGTTRTVVTAGSSGSRLYVGRWLTR